MNTIDQSFEILDCIPGKELKHIERIGRVCYKSEDKISEDDSSAKKFVAMLVEHGHLAMIEHANLAFGVSKTDYEYFQKLAREYSEKTKKPCFLRFSAACDGMGGYMVSGNMRAWKETLAPQLYPVIPPYIANTLKEYPEIFTPETWVVKPSADSYGGRVFPDDMLNEERKQHQTVSVKFLTNRGVSHEIVRHRPASFAQESTRYVNYSKDKFGSGIAVTSIDKGIELDAKMSQLDPEQIKQIKEIWEDAMQYCENAYLKMIELGATPQIARSVLATGIKTEITMTANIAEWEHFFKLRCDKAAHPEMREVAIPLKEEFVKRGYIKA